MLDALKQALHDRQPARRGGLIHHCDRGSQYVSIKYTKRLAEAGIEPSVQLRQRFARDDQRASQGRGDPQARAVAQLRSGRIRHARIGRPVQPSPAAGADRQHPACRSRRSILCCCGQHRYGSVTHTQSPPADPARFSDHGDLSEGSSVNTCGVKAWNGQVWSSLHSFPIAR